MKNPKSAVGLDKKEYTLAQIRVLLATNDAAMAKAIFRIWQYQTEYEKQVQTTVNRNHVGFTPGDSRLLSSMAQWYQKTGFLTPAQVKYARPRAMKYAGQILRIMAGQQ